MDCINKVLVLKQLLNGYGVGGRQIGAIARLEGELDSVDFHLSTVNFATISNGNYFVFLIGNGNLFLAVDLGARPTSLVKQISPFSAVDKECMAGIVVAIDDIPQVVAFSKTENCQKTLQDFKKAVAEFFLLQHKQAKQKTVEVNDDHAPENPTSTKKPVIEDCVTDVSNYDDEAVATQNYYSLDQEIENNLRRLKEHDYARLSDEDELFDCTCKKESQTSQENLNGAKNETYSNTCKNTYYDTVKKDLENIFDKFDEESCLLELFPHSRWAKVNYSPDKYYVVGVVKENGVEKYVCYGVLGRYSPTPPKQLENYCSFIPASPFDLHGEGYWMMFQDAVTGKCVKK